MLHCFGRGRFNERQSSVHSPLSRALAIAVILVIGAAGSAPASDYGSYSGTITVSGTETDPDVSNSATVRVNLPVSDRGDSTVSAEFLSGEGPNATATISTWNTFSQDKFADSGGMFNSVNCELADPVEIEMMATGVLNVDLKKKTHELSLTLLSLEDVAFNCTHSRSGPYKNKQGVLLNIGTGVPGRQYETQLPFSGPAQLTASYTLIPPADTGVKGKIVQDWDLRLTD